ncbi:hypothetical protein MLD38_023073 [Melastoma candidum]|uniref:Uncharacterized protein n=1 Tax=Melastoma candidum TaxID=119954 RepID=A0ACB9QKI3_9MYRT|nr:hypothetical protein MLD38_023073 [Melastoma candidum]
MWSRLGSNVQLLWEKPRWFPKQKAGSLTSSPMDVEFLQGQFLETIRTIFEEDYVDDNFKLLFIEQGMAESPDVAPQCIKSFFDDVEKHVDEIDTALKQSPVNYNQIELGTVRIMRKTAWIGAARIHRKACVALINTVHAQDKEECRRNLWKLKTEVSLLHNHLDNILMLQEEIMGLGAQVPLDWCR